MVLMQDRIERAEKHQKNAERGPSPNMIIASGSQAVTGIGRST